MRRNPKQLLWISIIATALAIAFILPNLWGNSFLPWRLGLDLVGGSHLIYEVDLSQVNEADHQNVLNGLRDVIERRINLFGVSEPQVYVTEAGGKSGLVVELAGIQDVNEAINQIGATPTLDFREVEENGTSTSFIPTALTGRYITSAQVGFSQTTRFPEINFSLNEEGAAIFEELTEKNIGKPICIFIDNQLIIPENGNDSCPRVQDKITGGNAVITGRFSLDTAKAIVERFNAGALPAPITLINQQTVSATLGADLLRKTIVAGAVGTLLVIGFMVAYYGSLGLIAALALAAYIPLSLALFKLIPGFTLTLAGLAGFILTIGMAVDANILIFERTKEEMKRGLPRDAAIDEGFRRAWSSIRDSNLTSMITAAVLYFFTTSFIKGFAVTLFLGVLMSMISAIIITWALLKTWKKI
ncbi:MAG: protein translocase subunit SecD [Anaplasmataceae bacterium]|nr:protein translocase subunit SecD [Anaplasmataceae bacterium]